MAQSDELQPMKWIRSFVDQNAASHIYSAKGTAVIAKIFREFTIDFQAAQLPLKELVPTPDINAMVDDILKDVKPSSVSAFIDLALAEEGKPSLKAGQLVLLEATEKFRERYRIIQPKGRILPILDKGEYLAYRPPFERIGLAYGQYVPAYLFHILEKYASGSKEMVRLLFKCPDSDDISKMLIQCDNCHARVLGIVGRSEPYRCRITYREGEIDRINCEETDWTIYVVAMDIAFPDNPELRARLSYWRDWQP